MPHLRIVNGEKTVGDIFDLVKVFSFASDFEEPFPVNNEISALECLFDVLEKKRRFTASFRTFDSYQRIVPVYLFIKIAEEWGHQHNRV